MTLSDAIGQIDSLGRGEVICARQPWSPASDAVVVPLTDQMRVPAPVLAQGYKYFLEVTVAREVLEALRGSDARDAKKRVELVLFYAENDAYPDWVG